MSEIVKIENLVKTYGDKVALNSINLEIPEGKIIGLLGPNGSGKTTLIKLLNGLLEPTEGSVLIRENKPGIESKKIISYLPERTYLSDWMKVKDIIDFFSDFYKDFNKERAMEMLENLKIDGDQKLKNMSKGTKEKVQLILVMAREAQLYILDEPIGGVDPAARDYIIKTIIKNYSKESSIIIATHLIQEIENICDEVIFLSEGNIILQGEADGIREERGKSIDALFREVFTC